MWVAASCGYPELPRLAVVDAAVDAALPLPPSCMGLALSCGPSGRGNCCEPAESVEGGTFSRGYDKAPDLYNDDNYPATVSTFVLDKYEVTVGRFRKFVEAGSGLGTRASPPAAGTGAHPRLAGSGWDNAWNTSLVTNTLELEAAVKCSPPGQTWTDIPDINENKPINCVTWHEAMAFCIWDGGYLPTEAEWNYAATGGDEQRAYPWSNPASDLTITCLHANYQINNPSGASCVGLTNRVGSESIMGDGRWKHSDLAGNVWELMLDRYADPYPYPQNCQDCANLMISTDFVIRGGSFAHYSSDLRTAIRYNNASSTRSIYIGFRCARSMT